MNDGEKILFNSEKKKSNTSYSLEDMLRWGIGMNANLSNMCLDYKLINGAYATSSVQANTVLLSIPESLVITEDLAKASMPGIALNNHLKKADVSQRVSKLTNIDPFVLGVLNISIFMVFEKYENVALDSSGNAKSVSFWAPYLCTLPTEYLLPLCWPEEIVECELKHTNLHFIVTERRRLLKEMLEIANEGCGHLFIRGSLNWENFLWAYCAISSRAFPRKKCRTDTDVLLLKPSNKSNDSGFAIGDPRNEECEVCMWPILDMLNHKTGQQMEWHSKKDIGVAFVTQQAVIEGEELFNNYGPKGNENFLSNYGFCVVPNTSDYVKLKLSASMNSTNSQINMIKYKLLSRLGHNFHGDSNDPTKRSEIFMLFIDDLEIPDQLISALRVLLMNDFEFTYLTKKKEWTCLLSEENCQSEHSLDQVSSRNEIAVWTRLMELLQRKLISIGIVDESWVENEEVNERVRLARIYKKGQTKILQDSLLICIQKLSTVFDSWGLPASENLICRFLLAPGLDLFPTGLIELTSLVCGEDGLDEDTIISLALCLMSYRYQNDQLETIEVAIWKKFFSTLDSRNFKEILSEDDLDGVTEQFEEVVSPILDYLKSADSKIWDKNETKNLV
ncbi:hypothetical protein HK096_005457, partial [Nowakowskiella sp. JEL0078]